MQLGKKVEDMNGGPSREENTSSLKEMSPVEVAEIALAWIEWLNPGLHACCLIGAEQTRQAVRYRDKRKGQDYGISGGDPLLCAMPVAVTCRLDGSRVADHVRD
jgi:hypothetical protein